MPRMNKLLVTVVLASVYLFVSFRAHAQSPGTSLTLYSLIQQLSIRADAMQARVDANAGPASSAQNIDVLQLGLSNSVYYINIGAWGASCGTDAEWNQGSVYAVVDGLELPLLPNSTSLRPDVAAAYSGFCQGGTQFPTRSGVNYTIPAAIFGTGPSGDGWHAVKLRTYDLYGRMSETPYGFVQVP